MPNVSSSGRVRTSFSISPSTHAWLLQYGSQRGMGEVIDDLVQQQRVLAPVEKRLHSLIDQLSASLLKRGGER